MKKKIIIAAIIIILLILLVPIPRHLKDGGTIEYNALTYKISKVNRLNDDGYEKGINVKIFGREIFNNVSNKKEEAKESKEEIKKYSTIVDDLKIELDIPNEWDYKVLDNDDTYKFALQLSKSDESKNATLYIFNDIFTVCGTGRTTKEMTLNNSEKVTIGTYGIEGDWAHIYFNDAYPNIAIINYGLLDEESNEALDFIRTLNIRKLQDIIVDSFKKIVEVSDSTSSNPYDYTQNEYYKNIVALGDNVISVLESMYNQKELTGVNAYLSALAIQDITKCNLYEKYDLDWSTAEEFYTLWKNHNCMYKS